MNNFEKEIHLQKLIADLEREYSNLHNNMSFIIGSIQNSFHLIKESLINSEVQQHLKDLQLLLESIYAKENIMNTTEIKIDVRKLNAAIIELPDESQYVVFLGNTGEVGEIFDTSYCADGKIVNLEKVRYPSSVLHGLKNKIYNPSTDEIKDIYKQIFRAVSNALEDGEVVISLKDKEVV